MASQLAVYASWCRLPVPHARLAPGCWSGFAGRDSHPKKARQKGLRFQLLKSFPLSRASWRNQLLTLEPLRPRDLPDRKSDRPNTMAVTDAATCADVFLYNRSENPTRTVDLGEPRHAETHLALCASLLPFEARHLAERDRPARRDVSRSLGRSTSRHEAQRSDR